MNENYALNVFNRNTCAHACRCTHALTVAHRCIHVHTNTPLDTVALVHSCKLVCPNAHNKVRNEYMQPGVVEWGGRRATTPTIKCSGGIAPQG